MEHSYKALKRRWEDWLIVPEDAQRTMERMDAAELKELLLSLREGGRDSQGERMMQESLRIAAARELYERDTEGGLKWAAEMGTKGNELFDLLIRLGAKKEPLYIRTWIERERERRGDDWAKQIASSAWNGGPAHGAETMLEVEKAYEGMLGGFGFTPEPFAEDFDFARYFKDSKPGQTERTAVVAWAARDPDAALAMIQGRENAGYLFGAAFEGISAMKGDAEAATWVAGKLDSLPPELREAGTAWLLKTRGATADRVGILMEALPRGEDRILIAKSALDFSGLNPQSEHTGASALGFLNPEQQVQALELSVGTYRQWMSRDPAAARNIQAGVERVMELAGLSEDSKARVRAAYAKP